MSVGHRGRHQSINAKMLLETLPNAVLDAVVECAGFDQGWRLEVVCASLRASSMECAASRLGKCRWIGESPRAGTEFKPCWRHVAVATRSGQYVLSFAGGVIHPLLEFSYPPQGPIDIGSGYMTFTDGPSGDIGVGSRTTTSRRQAMKFVVEPAPCLPAFTAGGPQNRVGPEGTGGYIQEVGSTRPQGNVGLVILGPNNGPDYQASLDTIIEPHLEVMKTWWLLHLESHVSHLPVCWGMRRNSEGQGPGRGPDTALRTSVCLSSWTTDSLKVESWELAPTALAPDERFEFQRNPASTPSRGKEE